MIRLLLVDARELVDRGLRTMLNLEADLEVVGVDDNGHPYFVRLAMYQTRIKNIALKH